MVPVGCKNPVSDPGKQVDAGQPGDRSQQTVMCPGELTPEQAKSLYANMEVTGLILNM